MLCTVSTAFSLAFERKRGRPPASHLPQDIDNTATVRDKHKSAVLSTEVGDNGATRYPSQDVAVVRTRIQHAQTVQFPSTSHR